MINSKFNLYYDFLVKENEKYNLTAITKKEDVEAKHFLDSISLLNFTRISGKSVCDVGSGAGFPGIPLKIMEPSIALTIIEPTQKRCEFLRKLCSLLELNVDIICARAEDAKEFRESFDVVVARAVAGTNVLLELCTPLVKVGGSFIAYKGPDALVEAKDAKEAAEKLNVSLANTYSYDLGPDYGKRILLEYKKVKNTPTIYPRSYSKIKKNSL